MSSGAASSRSAASSRRLLEHRVGGLGSTAVPPSCSERDPPVPPPRGTSAVSDCTKRIASIGMPSGSATIIANDVAWPWPCDDVPDLIVAVPSACDLDRADSLPAPPPVTST